VTLSQETFEEEVYKAYFIKSIVVEEGPMGLRPSPDMKTKAELLAKGEDGDYADEAISAMWFGWQLATGASE
jgi:hypothetical protein